LGEELDTLREESRTVLSNEQLSILDAMSKYRLSHSQAILFVTLNERPERVVSKESLASALEFFRPDSKPEGSMTVLMYHLKCNLSPHGMLISAAYGVGYVLKKGYEKKTYQPLKQKPKGFWDRKLKDFIEGHGDRPFTLKQASEAVGGPRASVYNALAAAARRNEVANRRKGLKGVELLWYKCNT
jgi:DNA-binding winged helix-turn-helix (wHTH) protein